MLSMEVFDVKRLASLSCLLLLLTDLVAQAQIGDEDVSAVDDRSYVPNIELESVGNGEIAWHTGPGLLQPVGVNVDPFFAAYHAWAVLVDLALVEELTLEQQIQFATNMFGGFNTATQGELQVVSEVVIGGYTDEGSSARITTFLLPIEPIGSFVELRSNLRRRDDDPGAARGLWSETDGDDQRYTRTFLHYANGAVVMREYVELGFELEELYNRALRDPYAANTLIDLVILDADEANDNLAYQLIGQIGRQERSLPVDLVYSAALSQIVLLSRTGEFERARATLDAVR